MPFRKPLLLGLSLPLLTLAAGAQALSLEPLGRYETGLATDGQTAGETAALRGDRLYVTNADDVSIDIVDVSRPAAPSLLRRVSLAEYGASVTSVAVSSKNLIAVAVVAPNKTDAGTVVLLTPAGEVLRTARVGALPDMLTFTPDGRRLLVANEGEPDCYGAGCTDPAGSVSIVTVVPMKPQLPVRTVGFDGVPLPAGVRVFGPGATPAQDLEPEYISVDPAGTTAYVTLQENNAVAEIDIATARVTRVRALGVKDFDAAPTTASFEVKNLPGIGATAAGQALTLGGFSGLFFEGRAEDGKLKFVTHTDRGPNGEPTGDRRPFLLPGFAPQLVRLQLDPATGEVTITQQIALTRADGSPLSGLPNTAIAGATASTPYQDEVPVDLHGNVLPTDPLGADLEGVVVDADGHFWMADEYRPAIYHFDPSGRLVERLVPIGTAAAAGAAPGTFGSEVLPPVLAQRRQNRGFEAIARQDGKLYAFVQSSLRNPTTLANSALNALRNVRVVEFDPATQATRQFLYVMDNPAPVNVDDSRADKIGDAVALPGGGFLVVERDDDAQPADLPSAITKRVYAFSLTGATDITALDTLYGGKSLDQMTTAELATVGVTPLAKVLRVDLARAGYDRVQKVEGLAYVDADTVAVINDNDFGVAGISIDTATGRFDLLPGYTPEPTLLGLVRTPGLDASDRDNLVNIRNWPVYGMYQPDAIASYAAGGSTYLVTANEGDARDYPGFAEEVRARSARSSYPADLQPLLNDNLQLGRLTISNTPPGGDYARPYLFGARSFTIWNAATGEPVWDSGAELEVRTAAAFPRNFNSNNSGNTFDDRSDNKGPEPEGVAVGKVAGRSYAFVGLERIGGVMVYDVTDPAAPQFVDYQNPRDFDGDALGPDSGPEVLRFIDAKDSPTGAPLLVVANEVTGTVTLWRLAP